MENDNLGFRCETMLELDYEPTELERLIWRSKHCKCEFCERMRNMYVEEPEEVSLEKQVLKTLRDFQKNEKKCELL